jgi:hypothetical protein
MPRQPRLDIAHIPQHIVQRGNDRQPCFFNDVDREENVGGKRGSECTSLST